jgi:hypothetical protein
MKTKFVYWCVALVLLSTLNSQLSTAFAQGTAFTYQGRLNNGTNPANGHYDFIFTVWNASSGGSEIGGTSTSLGVGVTNGLFTVTVDFGSGIFTGPTYWLQITVETNGVGPFVSLSPRQQLTPTPYAIFAEGANAAGLTGTIPAGDLSGAYGGPITLNNAGNSFSGNGAGLVNVNASLLGGLAASSFWQTTGNAGTTPGVNFVGTTDNQPLDFESDGVRGLELRYTSRSSGFPLFSSSAGVNVNGGYWGNTISNNIIGGTIAGGGDSFRSGITFFESPNIVSGDFGSVGGGYNNTAGNSGTVPGGYNNTATGAASFAAGASASAINPNSFVWSDGTAISSSANNSFDIHASGGVHINGTDLFLVANNDRNEGLGYRSSFAGTSINGPVLYSYLGGALGAVSPDTIALSWDYSGNVSVNNNLSAGSLTVRGEFAVVNGLGGVQCYIGDDGSGNDVQIGSLKSGITAVACYNEADNAYMHLYCSSITIEGGADLAEPFQISKPDQDQAISPGAVVVIDDQNPGHLKMSDQGYDTHVAGVVSGANGINPGIQMQQQGVMEGGKNVALTGRVYVQADTSNGAIKPGDLLTTSTTPGHAMKVTDHVRAVGAILGKAMTGLSEGKGMVLVLVTLQ